MLGRSGLWCVCFIAHNILAGCLDMCDITYMRDATHTTNKGNETMSTQGRPGRAVIFSGARDVRKRIRNADTLNVHAVFGLDVVVQKKQFLEMSDAELEQFDAHMFDCGYVLLDTHQE